MKNRMNYRLLATVLLFVFSYASAQQVDSFRVFKIQSGQRYLNFPVSEGAKTKNVSLFSDGKMLDHFTIKLATTDRPDYWVFFDALPYQGKEITVSVTRKDLPSFVQAFASISNANTKSDSSVLINSVEGLTKVFAAGDFPGSDSVYKEKARPQVHFTASRGWINDPNGLIYYGGKYHLFFQHNPYGWAWGNMHWGHAVSPDMVHWSQLPEAIYPYAANDAAFSGSAVVDRQNTAGFRKNGIDPLIAFYTSTGRGECIKLSYDSGKTFVEYAGNPVLKHKGRDPKVFWYEPARQWILVVYDFEKTKEMSLDQKATINQHLIYTSPDLKNWTFRSGIPGFFECPDFFALPVTGAKESVPKWVMLDATGRYIIGDFNGTRLTIEQDLKQYDYGNGYFYASQSFNHSPDGRRVQIGWGRGIIQPGMPFNQPMLFPTELQLRRTFDGLRLCPTPIKEIHGLHQDGGQEIENKVLKAGAPVSVAVDNGVPVHIVATFEKGDASQFGLNVFGYEFSYNDLIGELNANYRNKSMTTHYIKRDTETFKIEAIADKNIIEVFINDGEIYYVGPMDERLNNKIEAFVKGRNTDNKKSILKNLQVYTLKSIWK